MTQKRLCNEAGPVSISSAENVRGWIGCPSCGKKCKVRRNASGVATIRPHKEAAK